MNAFLNVSEYALNIIINLKDDEKFKVTNEFINKANSNVCGTEFNCGIDLYCSKCNNIKTFIISNNEFNKSAQDFLVAINHSLNVSNNVPGALGEDSNFEKYKGKFVLELLCPICKENIYFYYVYEKGYIIKIGTYPSQMEGLKLYYRKYKALNTQKFKYDKEFITGLFLYKKSNSGIGAYCYLRRCLENVIIDSLQELIDEGKIKEEDIKTNRFVDKIDLLKDYIDSEIYNLIKPLYGILSKGIHELDENLCLNEFQNLCDVVEIILDDKLSKNELKEKIQKHQKNMNLLQSKIK